MRPCNARPNIMVFEMLSELHQITVYFWENSDLVYLSHEIFKW